MLEACIAAQVPAWSIGGTSESDGLRLLYDGNLAEAENVPLADLRAAHEGFFPKLMGASLEAL